MARGAFVSRDWVGPMLASLITLLALLGQPGEAGGLVVLAVATSFGWSAVARSMLASPRLGEGRRVGLLRRVCTGQMVCVLCFWALLMVLGHPWPGAAVLVVGGGLAMLTWPWPWRLAQAADDRGRARDPGLGHQHLMAAGILLVLAVGSAIALGVVASVLLVALLVSSLADVWDERRRPRTAATPAPQIDPTIVLPAQRSSRRALKPAARPRSASSGAPVTGERANATARDATVKLDATADLDATTEPGTAAKLAATAELEATATLPVQRRADDVSTSDGRGDQHQDAPAQDDRHQDGSGTDDSGRDDRRRGARRRENPRWSSRRRGRGRRAQSRYSGRRVASRRS